MAILFDNCFNAALSDRESTDSDYDELQTCEICSTEEVFFNFIFLNFPDGVVWD